jgi:hypothetical protein
MKIVYALLLAILVSGCAAPSDSLINKSEPGLEGEASYADYINVNGKHYINAWELALTDPAELKQIGKVDKGHFIQEGAAVYEIAGYPEHGVVAVKDDGAHRGLADNLSGYLIYVQNAGGDISFYPKIQDLPVKKINVYKNGSKLRELTGADLSAFLTLFDKQGPHNEFRFKETPAFTVEFVAENSLGLNYGIMEKEGQYGLPHIESRLPDEIAEYLN